LGGYSEDYSQSIELLTPDMSCFPAMNQLPQTMLGAYAFLLSSKIYYCGGLNDGAVDACYSFSSIENLWQTESSMVYASSDGAVSTVGSVAYVTGGNLYSSMSGKTVQSFSEGGIWQEEISMVMTTDRMYHCSAVIGSRLFVIGGWNSDNSDGLSTIQSFDTSNLENKWQDHHPMNTLLYHHACQTETFDGQLGIFVTGGNDGQQIINNVQFYVADVDLWDDVGTLKTARRYHTMSFIDGKMMVAGGGSHKSSYLQSVETFNGVEWEEIYNLNVNRSNHAAISFPAEMITCYALNSKIF